MNDCLDAKRSWYHTSFIWPLLARYHKPLKEGGYAFEVIHAEDSSDMLIRPGYHYTSYCRIYPITLVGLSMTVVVRWFVRKQGIKR